MAETNVEQFRRWREDTFEVIDEWRLELDEVVTGDDPDVLVGIHWRQPGCDP